jgi:predicted aspartyl protease
MKRKLTLCLGFVSSSAFAGVTPWLDFTLENGHVKVPTTVSGIPSKAILDTGAQMNGINPRFINKNELDLDKGGKTRVRGAYGVEDKNTYNNVPINLFGMETTINDAVEINLGHHENSLLFGAGFFRQFVMQIDYPNQKMRLITHDALDLSKMKNIKMEKQKGSGMPIVEVELSEGKSIWLILDTGNNGGMVVYRNVARKMVWIENIDRESQISRGATTSAVTETFRIPWLKFGPFEMENVQVSIPDEGETANLRSQFATTNTRIKGRNVEGLIGYDVLKHFLITIDYRRGNAHIGLPEES